MAAVITPVLPPIGPSMRLNWGPIIGGAFVALAAWIMLYALGLALGLTAIDPKQPDSTRTAGLISGIWSVVTPLVALFIGAYVASRTAGIVDRVVGAMHGAVLWAITTVIGVLVVGSAASWMIGAAMSTGGKVVAATASAGGHLARSGSQSGSAAGIADSLGLDLDRMLEPVNRRLEQQGKPSVTADQLANAAQDVVRRGLSEGRLDSQLLISAISDNTQLSRSDAQELAGQIQQQFDQRRSEVQGRAGSMAQSAQKAALSAADTTGKIFWGIFIALFLGLVSSLVGATVGVGGRRRTVETTATPGV
jgi:hypothetical protein